MAFTPDSQYLVTACNEGTWRLFDTYSNDYSTHCLIVCDDGHDLGVQGCDFSPTTGPFAIAGYIQFLVLYLLYLLAIYSFAEPRVKIIAGIINTEQEIVYNLQ